MITFDKDAAVRIISGWQTLVTWRYGAAGAISAALMSGVLGACSSAPGVPAAPAATRRATVGASVVSAPVRIAHTSLGAVGYRMVGSGPPLVLIMGYSGTMEDWDPRFVDALALHHRVVIFDNAGVGRSQPLPGSLTIDAMANQTSALIDSLGLGRTDVLGWSMGGMIAQALAVLHRSQVRRLVLCATFPGTGHVTLPSRAAVQGLTSGNAQRVAADLFPADQVRAYDAFIAAIAGYPPAAPPSFAVIAAQGQAVTRWWSGTDAAGSKTASISVPTLIADGTADRIDPVSNARLLASIIRNGKLVLYPDAGHAFLFQLHEAFVTLIQSFLARRSPP